MKIEAVRSTLAIIDVQERLLPAMRHPEQVLKGCTLLLSAARHLHVPILVTEQYPKGLGPTLAPVRSAAGGAEIREKISFSIMEDGAIADGLIGRRGAGRPQVVVAGIEAHVCVLQSCLDLNARGFDVFVVADAVSSRRQDSVDIALSRLSRAGVMPVTVEMVVFEWLERAGTDDFKALSKLVK